MADRALHNINIISQDLMPTPSEICGQYPASEAAAGTVWDKREEIKNVLSRRDPRMLVIVGPCSIHDIDSAMEYARRLRDLAQEVAETQLVLMRVYFEKPRTSVGWKGLINDPYLDDSFRLGDGLCRARELLLQIAELGLGVGSEALDPITPQYVSDLMSWVAIGARTSESQTHREMASGLSAPVGIKNGTDGNIDVALNALEAIRHPQHFLGVTSQGRCAVFHTSGNHHGHIILRGGGRPNYDSVSIAMCERALKEADLPANIMVDCSHGNSLSDHEAQPSVMVNCVNQIRDGNKSIVGFMLESNLEAGNQRIPKDPAQLRRGVSITDACLDWETTAQTLRAAHVQLLDLLPQRSPAPSPSSGTSGTP